MRKSSKAIRLLSLVLVFILAACAADDTSDPTATLLPTATLVPTNTPIPPPPEAGPSSLDLDAPEVFQDIPGDYTLRMDFRFEGQHADGADASG